MKALPVHRPDCRAILDQRIAGDVQLPELGNDIGAGKTDLQLEKCAQRRGQRRFVLPLHT